MSDNENKLPSLWDIMNIRSIVIVDDARTVSEEDMAEIRKSLEQIDKTSQDDNVIDSGI